MLTRCPGCETTFRVTPEQLKARAGRVRCGECQHAFSALDTLIEEPMMVMAPAPPALPITDFPLDDPEIAVPPAPTLDESPPEPEFPAPAEPQAEPAVLVQEPPPEPSPELYPEPFIPEPEPRPETLVTEPEPLPDFLAEPPSPRRWPWVLGSLVAIAVLFIQLALAFRVEIAVLMPGAKPALVTLCEMAGCELGLPRKAELVSIEASDLHPDPAQKNRLALTATLKNRAPFAQEFPHLELTLTDTADRAVARKVLAPADYLPAATQAATGMPPRGDIAIAFGVDPRDLPASGYRLYLFYP